MRLKRIYGENFLSIKKFDYSLDNQGAVLIHGSNGKGKTTFVELIYYAFFGETTKDLPADEIVNNVIGKNTQVVVTWEDEDDNNQKYKIIRCRKHEKHKNSVFLYIGDKDITGKDNADTQERINQILGLNAKTFSQSVLFPQGAGFRFSDATDKERKNIFDNVLNLTTLTTCKEIIKEKMAAVSTEYELNKSQQEIKVADLAKTESLLVDVETKEERHVAQQQAQVERLTKDREKTAYLHDQLDDELEELKKSIMPMDVLNQEAQKAQINLKLAKTQQIELRDKHQKDLLPLEGGIAFKRKEIEEIKRQLLKFQELSGVDCPTCLRPVEAHYAENICNTRLGQGEVLRAELSGLKKDIEKCNEDFTASLTTLTKLEQELQANVDSLQKSMGEARAKEEKKKGMERQLQMYATQLQNIDQQLAGLAKNQSSLKDTIQKTQVNADQIKSEIAIIENNIVELASAARHYEFWDTGFGNKGLKSYILDAVVPYLNERAQYYTQILTNGQIDVKFKTQTRLKSGELRENFAVEITNNEGGNSYKSNSGGEKRRIDLAISLALQDLVSSRNKKRFNISIFDECFENLDNDGVEVVVQLLRQMAQEKESIFIISHQDELKMRFPKQLFVTKEDGFTEFQQI